jgi:hypothetical protein
VLLGDGKIFYEILNENILLRQMPFVLGLAYEYSSLKIRQEEVSELEKLWKSYKEVMPKYKEEMIMPQNKKAICLLYAHLHNQTLSSPAFKEDLDYVLKIAPLLLNNMYTMAIQLTQFHMFNKNVKNFGYECVKTILEFSQILHQRLSYNNSSPFLQLPYFDDGKIKSLKKQNSSEKIKLTTFQAYLDLTPEDRTTLLKNDFKPEEILDIENATKTLPQYNFKIEVFVDGFEEILIEDFLTIKVTVTRNNLKENQVLNIIIFIGTWIGPF